SPPSPPVGIPGAAPAARIGGGSAAVLVFNLHGSVVLVLLQQLQDLTNRCVALAPRKVVECIVGHRSAERSRALLVLEMAVADAVVVFGDECDRVESGSGEISDVEIDAEVRAHRQKLFVR